jgi:hypothetical protein
MEDYNVDNERLIIYNTINKIVTKTIKVISV